MEEIFLAIVARIGAVMPELSLIDEDNGQLETEEETYPVTFPCVLAGHVNVDWTPVSDKVQKGTATMTVRLAIDCYDDTHRGSGTEDRIAERLAMAHKVFEALQGFYLEEGGRRYMSPMVRVKSVDYGIRGGIKVYETTFRFMYHDNSLV
jgi:hypothetical protein